VILSYVTHNATKISLVILQS